MPPPTKRSYARDIGYGSLALGTLMVIAALGSLVAWASMPGSELPPFGGMTWVFAHPLLMGSLQLAQGILVLLSARAYVRGKPRSRVLLRLLLAFITVEWIVFTIVWIPTINGFFSQMPGQWGVTPTVFEIVAVLSALSFIVPLTLAVWYLGKPEAASADPRERVV